MKSIEQKGDEFLLRLFEKTAGKLTNSRGIYEIGRGLGFDQASTKEIARYLKEQELITHVSAGTFDSGVLVSITQKGIERVNQTL